MFSKVMRRSSGFAILLIALLLSAPSLAVRQPIDYNHKKHVQDLGLDCTECHRYAKELPRATIPNIEVCSDCHSEAMTDSPEEQKLLEYIQKGEKIPWRKIYRVPRHGYFSHRRHTVLGQVPCEECHGEVGAQEHALSEPLVPIRMKRCLACHERHEVHNDCTRCHR
jgi:hypothetical protein